jgi:transcriptional regulator with XRE-family HTH domain
MKMMNKSPHNEQKKDILDAILDRISPVDSRKVEDRMLLAARIADLIKDRGLGKKDFAQLLGKEPSLITRWLSGTHNFTQDTLTEISFALGVPMSEFYRERVASVVYRSAFEIAGMPSYINVRPAGGYLTSLMLDPEPIYPNLIIQGTMTTRLSSMVNEPDPKWADMVKLVWTGTGAIANSCRRFRDTAEKNLDEHNHVLKA